MVLNDNHPADNGRAVQLTLSALAELWEGEEGRGVLVRLWDGTAWPDRASPRTTIFLKHPGSLRAIFLPGTEIGVGEAYLHDDFDVEGDIEAVFAVADRLSEAALGSRTKLRVAARLRHLPADNHRGPLRRGPARLRGRRHSIARDRQAVTYHYDVSNDFFALWLDRRMVYSCAYFHAPGEDLDTAQERKLDYICRKLRLRPGQRLLDIGCGWGGLVLFAADRYGVDATGITLSEPQAELANERITAAGLADRCRVEVRDYREMEAGASYDALVSVGMVEHVGAKLLPTYFDRSIQLLKPGGVFLNHGIAGRAGDEGSDVRSFIDAYVFPDGELPPLHRVADAAEESGFEIRDVENLREHYVLTLRQWVRRLEAQHTAALEFVDEPTYRVWRLYMAGSAHGFDVGRLNLHQTLLVKPNHGASGLPFTRADWYAD